MELIGRLSPVTKTNQQISNACRLRQRTRTRAALGPTLYRRGSQWSWSCRQRAERGAAGKTKHFWRRFWPHAELWRRSRKPSEERQKVWVSVGTQTKVTMFFSSVSLEIYSREWERMFANAITQMHCCAVLLLTVQEPRTLQLVHVQRESWKWHATMNSLHGAVWLIVEVLLYDRRNRRLIRGGSPGRPPRLSHSSWALIYVHRNRRFFRKLGTGAQDGHLDFHTAPELSTEPSLRVALITWAKSHM